MQLCRHLTIYWGLGLLKPGLKQTYELEKKKRLAIGKFNKRAAGLFNRKFFAKRVCGLLQGAM